MQSDQQWELPERFWCFKRVYEQLHTTKLLFRLLFIDYRLCFQCIFRLYAFEQNRLYSDTQFCLEILPTLLEESDKPLLEHYDCSQCCLNRICWLCQSMLQKSFVRESVDETIKQIAEKGFGEWQQFKLNIRIPNIMLLRTLLLVRYLYHQQTILKAPQETLNLLYSVLILPLETGRQLEPKLVLKWLLATQLTEQTGLLSTSDDNDRNLVVSLELETEEIAVEAGMMKLFSSYLGLEKKEKSKGRKQCLDLEGKPKPEVKHTHQTDYKCNAHNLGKILGLKQAEFQGILEKLGSRQKFWEIVGGEPQATARIRHKMALLTKNVYICGKYIKYSRYLSQTPWLVNGRKLTEGSLQEEIEDRIFSLFYPGRTKESVEIRFHSGGREDIDVRMLQGGRPFVLEFVNPIRQVVDVTEQEVMALAPEQSRTKIQQEFKEWIRAEKVGEESSMHSWRVVKLLQLLINWENQNVQVLDLQETTESFISVQLKAAETEKIKHYLCVIHSLTAFEEKDRQILDSMIDIPLQQLTPLRVLHRRTLMSREKTIHRLRFHLLSKHSAVLEVWASAGTYIKEFVHGDLGRTTPNVGSLIGKEVDILQLDVGSLKEGEWRAGDELLMRMQTPEWIDA